MDIPQCGNLAIFLPQWFYVKSILADFRRSKTAVLAILGLWILFFGKNSHLKCQTFPKIENSELFKNQMVKLVVIGASKWPKLISFKIRVPKKSRNFHIVYSEFGCPGLYGYFEKKKKTHFSVVDVITYWSYFHEVHLTCM